MLWCSSSISCLKQIKCLLVIYMLIFMICTQSTVIGRLTLKRFYTAEQAKPTKPHMNTHIPGYRITLHHKAVRLHVKNYICNGIFGANGFTSHPVLVCSPSGRLTRQKYTQTTLWRRLQIVQTCYVVMKTGFTFKKRYLKHSGFNEANMSFMLLFFLKDIL